MTGDERDEDDLPSEANSAAMTILVTENPSRADLVRSEEVAKLVLVHRFREVGHVEVSVSLVGKRLELRVERLLRGLVSGSWEADVDRKLPLAKLTS